MKKSTASLLFTLTTIISSGLHAKEIDIGTVLIGGDLDLSYTDSKREYKNSTGSDIKSSSGIFDVSAFYYLTPNLGAGAMLGYNRAQYTLGDLNVVANMKFYGPAVQIDHSLTPSLNGRFGASFAMGDINQEVQSGSTSGNLENKLNIFIVAAELGYFVNDHTSLDLSLVRQSVSITNQRKLTLTGLQAGVSILLDP